jgi:hypothetical protein
MAETNKNIDDGIILLKYGLVVAFARKIWKLKASIERYLQIRPITKARLATKHPINTQNTKLCTLLLRGKRQPTCIHQTMYWIICEYLFVYIFVSNCYSHKSSNWNRRGWVDYGQALYVQRLVFFLNKLYIKDRVFYTSEYSISN